MTRDGSEKEIGEGEGEEERGTRGSGRREGDE